MDHRRFIEELNFSMTKKVYVHNLALTSGLHVPSCVYIQEIVFDLLY